MNEEKLPEDFIPEAEAKAETWESNAIKELIKNDEAQPDVRYATKTPDIMEIRVPMIPGSLVFVDAKAPNITIACKVDSCDNGVSKLTAIWGMKTNSPMLDVAKEETLKNFESWKMKQAGDQLKS